MAKTVPAIPRPDGIRSRSTRRSLRPLTERIASSADPLAAIMRLPFCAPVIRRASSRMAWKSSSGRRQEMNLRLTSSPRPISSTRAEISSRRRRFSTDSDSWAVNPRRTCSSSDESRVLNTARSPRGACPRARGKKEALSTVSGSPSLPRATMSRTWTGAVGSEEEEGIHEPSAGNVNEASALSTPPMAVCTR